MKDCKLLLFDLDGTLLCSDKTISQRTLQALRECRKDGIAEYLIKAEKGV